MDDSLWILSALPTCRAQISCHKRKTSTDLQASLASVKDHLHDSTIRKTLGKNGIHVVCSSFAKKITCIGGRVWNSILWID
uniref:Uncharacterized protein n=1 Tax=Acanthochromis polyacanthus TaxID=80966 RepID=A0A3Q1EDI3_9TELE